MSIGTKQMNMTMIEQGVRFILEGIGDDINREGLIDTPKRAAKMFAELCQGLNYTNEQVANMYSKCFEQSNITNLVVESGIPVFSLCEHHLALMYNMKVHIAYLPQGKVLGLSKLARMADMVAKRPQLQEKIGTDLVEVMQLAGDIKDVAVIIEGEHACMAARGIKKPGTVTKTTTLTGKFLTDPMLRQELYALLAV